MKLTKEDYIKENIKLSYKNTHTILTSILTNIQNIKKISIDVQKSTDKQSMITGLIKIKDISLESIVEKCNMLKASIDRYTIPYEDVNIPKEIKYMKFHNYKSGIQDPASNPRFRDKISKTNMPPILTQVFMEEDDGGEGDSYD